VSEDGYGSDPSIRGSYATGRVTGGGDNVGGLAGAVYGSSPAPAIMGSYATGMVSGAFLVGGLVGRTDRGISYSYAVGRVSGSGAVGGLVGDGTGTVTDSYWDTVTSGQSQSDGGQGKTTVELQSPTGYSGIYANWNVDLDGDGVEDDPWDFGTPYEYPVLKYGNLKPCQQPREAAISRNGVLSPVSQQLENPQERVLSRIKAPSQPSIASVMHQSRRKHDASGEPLGALRGRGVHIAESVVGNETSRHRRRDDRFTSIQAMPEFLFKNMDGVTTAYAVTGWVPSAGRPSEPSMR